MAGSGQKMGSSCGEGLLAASVGTSHHHTSHHRAWTAYTRAGIEGPPRFHNLEKGPNFASIYRGLTHVQHCNLIVPFCNDETSNFAKVSSFSLYCAELRDRRPGGVGWCEWSTPNFIRIHVKIVQCLVTCCLAVPLLM